MILKGRFNLSDQIEVVSPAKINLFLEVLGKRDDGYHEVELVMQTINLKDTVNIYVNKFQKEEIKICSNNKDLPIDKENLSYKAVEILKEGYYLPPLKIKLTKNIPVAAGLAGGSSNASAVLWGLNELFEFNLTEEKLKDLAKRLGADVPFCLRGGTMLATGLGEKLTKVPSIPNCYLLLINPPFGVSTSRVYKNLNKSTYEPLQYKNLLMSGKLIKALEQKSLDKIADNLYNSMQPVVKSWFPVVGDILQMILKNGALGVLMSGSGPTVYGLFKDKKQAELTGGTLKKWCEGIQFFVTTPRRKGVGKE